VEKARKEKIAKIQKNSKIKEEKMQNFAQKLKEEQERRQKIIKLEEKKQKKHMEALNRQRQEKVDEYYEKLRYEEMNPRQINKEKEMRIEEIKNRNIILNERVKSASQIREKDLEQRGEQIINDIKKKEIITKRIMEEKKIIASQLQEENEGRKIAFEYNHQKIENDKQNKLEELREELDDKKKRVNDFLLQKELIAKEARYISDQMTYQKQIYREQFDNMFSKKGLDEYAYMNIKEMIGGDPNFKEICQYYEGK
jgi:hypothetical protein